MRELCIFSEKDRMFTFSASVSVLGQLPYPDATRPADCTGVYDEDSFPSRNPYTTESSLHLALQKLCD